MLANDEVTAVCASSVLKSPVRVGHKYSSGYGLDVVTICTQRVLQLISETESSIFLIIPCLIEFKSCMNVACNLQVDN